MRTLQIAEVFGHPVDASDAAARADRDTKRCPFRDGPCNKGNKDDPLGVCSLADGSSLATLCPVRFTQHQRIITDVGRLAFGSRVKVIGAPEVHLLRIPSSTGTGKEKRVGKIDYLVAKLDAQNNPVDFAALEVQAVYFSGKSIKPSFKEFLATENTESLACRRPDWRSSTQKRLMPQLFLKVPVFRRWGKRFFVAVDSLFFSNIPPFKTTDSLENSEITWLAYPFTRKGQNYQIGAPQVMGSLWDDVQVALREGSPPTQAEILAEIARKQKRLALRPLLT